MRAQQQRSPGGLRRWALHAVRGALIALAVVLGIVAVLGVVGPRFGYSYAVVKSGSMAPAYPPGSIILIGATSPAALGPGDVISFRAPGQSRDRIITHRVVEARQGASGLEFVTQGDANDDVDSRAVPASDVRGRVLFGVPLIGSLAALLQQRGLFMGVVAVCAAVIVVMEATSIVREVRRSRRRTGRQPDVAPPFPAPSTDRSLPSYGAQHGELSGAVAAWARLRADDGPGEGRSTASSGRESRNDPGREHNFRWVRSGVLSALLALVLFWTMPLVGAQLTDSASTTGSPIPMRTYGTLRLGLETDVEGPIVFVITPSIQGNDQIAGCSTFVLSDGQTHTCELLRPGTAYYISAPVPVGTLSASGSCVPSLSSSIEVAVHVSEPALVACTITHALPPEPAGE